MSLRPKLAGLLALVLLTVVSPADARGTAPPEPPFGLRVTGDSYWQSRNGIEVTWVNPAEAGAGLKEAELTIVDLADGSAGSPSLHSIRRGPRIGEINLPHRGEFRIEVRLRDMLGNFSLPESTWIGFDDSRPSDVSPEAATGWLSADEFPYEMEIERAQAAGPSGISGYAVSISGNQAARPCPAGSCLRGELSLSSGADARTVTIDRLGEGVHWVSAVGVSGAGLASAVPGEERLRVDRTEPVSTVEGVPQGWARGPVEIEVVATDSGSGMVAKPASDNGDPVTVIRAGGDPALVSRGDRATLRISGEGATRVRYWARDLAGNANDGGLAGNGEVHGLPGEATVRIDRRSPVVSVVEERDPEDPELLRATVRDTGSGVESGTIAFRAREDSGEFRPLETSLRGDEMSARLPSDELPPGSYEIRAEAFDRAGNRGLSDDVRNNPVLKIPLKRPTAVSVRFTGRPAAAADLRVESRRDVRISGRVSGARGASFAGVPVLVEQEYAPGSPRKRTVDTVLVDRGGRFSAVLAAGPSRKVRLRFTGTRIDRPSMSRKLTVRAADRVRFRVSPDLLLNGGTATMSGRVSGRGVPPPADGKLLAIQYFDPSRDRWRPVEVIRTDPRGRFEYRYRFRTIAYAQKILFRAVSLPEAGWPFESTRSRHRRVIVYPSR
ncbi:MAG TPA: hypothetical protein VMF31_10270 [Solirubrobacterales bacterium]|nr:hypothetical protein [Solirubrobacterales bacterium]